MLRALTDATLFTGEAMVEGHALLLNDGKILDILPNSKLSQDTIKISYRDKILSPGFIDLQVNGGDNVLFNNDPTPHAVLRIAAAHARFGTTRILPTCITDRSDVTLRALKASRQARKTLKSILGIHLEGPHLGERRRGVHKSEYMRRLSAADLAFYEPEKNEIVLMTIAPEAVDLDQIKELKKRGLILSIGHTDAKPAEITASIKAGVTGFTHLFNAMGKPNTDVVTPADTALSDESTYCGIIMDGYHVTDAMLQLALSKKPGKIFLVSDAMAPAGSKNPESFLLYGEEIKVENGRCVNKEGKLAGSSITLRDAIRNTMKAGVSLEEALRMASFYPASFLGLEQKLGKLLPGFDADIAVITPGLDIEAVWVAGQKTLS